MTFRSKPAVKRSHRPSWEEKDRRNLYINIGFAIVIAIGVLTLAGAAAATYYEAHLSTVATVNGTSLNRDQLNDQSTIDAFRIDRAEAQLRRPQPTRPAVRLRVPDPVVGHRAAAQLDRRQHPRPAHRQHPPGQLAAQQGITVTDAQVDQRLLDEATTKEQRRLSMISVQPEVSTGATVPTDAQKAAAKTKAEAALAEVKGGKKFAEVAQKVSTDAYAANGGDTGWSLETDASLDSTLLAAAFKTAQGGLTEVIEGADGTYRFAQVVDVAPQIVDTAWTSKIEDARISLSTYRAAVRSDLNRDALQAKVVADVTEQATPQRQVSEIFVSSADYQGPGDQVKVRHILYTPGDADPSTGSPVPSDAASLAAAKVKAQATYDKLKALQGDPAALLKEFEAIAKTDSKDTTSGADGGQLGWYSPRVSWIAGSATRSSPRGSRTATSSGRSRASTAGTSSSTRIGAGRRRTGSTGSRRRSTRPVPTSPRWPGRTRMRPTRPPAATCAGWPATSWPRSWRTPSSPPRWASRAPPSRPPTGTTFSSSATSRPASPTAPS